MAEPDNDESGWFLYNFRFDSGKELKFRVDLNKPSALATPGSEPPAWTRLSCHRCPNCTLDEASMPHCPIALNLVELIEGLRDHLSYEEVDAEVVTAERRYLKRLPLQRAASSLIGLRMVSSGCPIMEKLRPMARYHLPFGNLEETRYRAISMYLTAQFMRSRNGLSSDWNLDHLGAIYSEIGILNASFFERLSEVKMEDASLNAVVILSNFSGYIPLTISANILEDLQLNFAPYLEGRTKMPEPPEPTDPPA